MKLQYCNKINQEKQNNKCFDVLFNDVKNKLLCLDERCTVSGTN